MNLTENDSCLLNVVADFDIFIPPVFIGVVLVALFVGLICRCLSNNECRCSFPYWHDNWHNFVSLLLIIFIIGLTSSSTDEKAVVQEDITLEENNYIYMITAWCLLFSLIVLDLMKVFPKVIVSSCNVFHVFLLTILTIPCGRDIYYVQHWYKQCLSTDERLSYGICLQIRLVITATLWTIQLIYARRRDHYQSDRLLNESGVLIKKKRELNVWMPSASGGTLKFFNALNNRLTKYGIRLQRISKAEMEDAEHVIAVCNCCTRINVDIKEISGLDSHLQQKISIVIILYLSKAQYNSSNVRYVKADCQNIKDIVEIFFTPQLENGGITDTPENMKALETITNSVKRR